MGLQFGKVLVPIFSSTGGGGPSTGGQGTFWSSCHVLHYHMVLCPKGTSHNDVVKGYSSAQVPPDLACLRCFEDVRDAFRGRIAAYGDGVLDSLRASEKKNSCFKTVSSRSEKLPLFCLTLL